MRYPKLRELKEAIKALIKGPYTSKFPYQPHKPYERFRGKPQYHEDDCIGCGACYEVCPSKAIEMKDTGGKRVLTLRLDLCIFCGQCQVNCPTEKGIILSNEFDLATTQNRQDLKEEVEKDLVFCECCSDAIAPADQILWVAKKIGPLVFSNPSLILSCFKDSSPASQEKPALQKKEEYLRADRIKILCPRCRREAVLKS